MDDTLAICREVFRAIMEFRNGQEQDWQDLAGKLENVIGPEAAQKIMEELT